MSKRSWKFIPETTLGGWALGLVIVMPVLFVIGSSFADSLYESVTAGGTILADITARPILALTMLAGMATGVSGLITGLLAIARQKDHALLVYLATLVGGLFTVFLIVDLAFPH